MKNKAKPYPLSQILSDCKKGVRSSQKRLYQEFYSYGLTVCLHYSKNREEAEEILNDGFVKVFDRISQYQGEGTFKSWLRQILVRSAIDYYRKFHKSKIKKEEILAAQEDHVENEALYNLSMDDALRLLQLLSPAYRIVFNLFILEGRTHAEIARLLHIEIGTSKSNLAKARKNLQQLAIHYYQINPNTSKR